METTEETKAPAVLELGSLEASETAEIVILHPNTNEPIGLNITVYGCDSEHYRALERKRLNKRMDKVMKRGKLTAEDNQAENLNTLAQAVHSWGPTNPTLDGEPLACTVENVKRVFLRFPFIKEQVDEAIVDRSLFIKS